MKREVLIKYLIFTFFFFLLIFGFYNYKESKSIIKENCVTFNKESGFYSESIKVKLRKNVDLPLGSEIYYTLDGNKPNKKSTKYKGSIELKLVEGETKVYPLKVVAYYKNQYSKVLEKTYVIDSDINSNDINIISITSNDENLYDYNKGILVPGITYDSNDSTKEYGYRLGNYSIRSDDWIRSADIVMFDKNGNIKINQKIGLGISGGTSSELPIKSFKIISNYKSNKKFEINLHNSNVNNVTDYSHVNAYNSLRLRSGMQDPSGMNIRNGIANHLAEESNFDGASATTEAIVFLNGSFYGLFDIQQTFSNSLIKNKYSLDDSNKVNKYKRIEQVVLPELDIYKYFYNDLNESSNREQLENFVDMDNYLLYYAIEVLLDNNDWPKNNFETWNYTGKYNENNKYTDGRYRFLLYDLDVVYFSHFLYPDKKIDVFKSFMENKYNSVNSTFINVLNSKYYRDKYVMLTQDLLKTSFREDNVLSVIDNEYNKRIKSFNKYSKNYKDEFAAYEKFYTDEQYINKLELFKPRYIYEIKQVNEKIDELKDEAKQRDDSIKDNFKKYFGLENTHKVNVIANKGIQINFSNQELYQNQKYTNEYYVDIDLRYNYKEYPGYEFKYWLVNGKKIYDKELVIESEKYHAIDKINIEAVAEYKKTDNHLLITEIYAKGDSDWIKITNAGRVNINLNEYYLSDREKNLRKYQLPNKKLKPNESIIVNGNKNYYSLGDYICNFNMSENEKIVLSKNDNIVETIIVPRMSDIETYGRYNYSNTYKFFMNENNERKTIK